MPLTDSDKNLIKALVEERQYTVHQIRKEFPNRNFKKRTLHRFVKRLQQTGRTTRLPGSGRRRSVRTEENVKKVSDLVLSQEDKPGTSLSVRKTSTLTGIKRSSVQRICKKDLRLKTFKRVPVHYLSSQMKRKRVERCKKLLKKFTSKARIEKIWFSDEKKFTIERPNNTQNDRVRGAVQKKVKSPNLAC